MARIRDINDIDDDEEGQIDYLGDSDIGDKPTEILPEDKFRRRPAPDLGALDTSQPLEFSVLRQDNEILVRSNQAFRGEAAVPVGLDLPKAPTHQMVLEKLQKLFPEMVEGVQWDLTEGGFRNETPNQTTVRVCAGPKYTVTNAPHKGHGNRFLSTSYVSTRATMQARIKIHISYPSTIKTCRSLGIRISIILILAHT